MNNISLSVEQMNPVYLAFGDPGFHWGLFLPALVYAILATIGIPLNASVCWVTIKHRSILCNNTCIFLALNSFFEILHQMGYFNFFVLALSGINFYPLRLAFPIQSYSVIGCLAGSIQVALLSLDRLFSVFAPLYYRQLSQSKYIFCHLLINFSICAFYLKQMISSAKNLAEWPCTGLLGDLFVLPNAGPLLWSTALGINLATIFAYLLVGIKVRLKTEVSTERQQKIYHSLLLIVLINVATYFYSLFFHVFYQLVLLPLTPLQFWYLNMFNGAFFFNVGVMLNAPILYFNSIDYRKAYEKEFKKSIKLLKIVYRKQQQQSAIKIVPISNHIIVFDMVKK